MQNCRFSTNTTRSDQITAQPELWGGNFAVCCPCKVSLGKVSLLGNCSGRNRAQDPSSSTTHPRPADPELIAEPGEGKGPGEETPAQHLHRVPPRDAAPTAQPGRACQETLRLQPGSDFQGDLHAKQEEKPQFSKPHKALSS